MEKKFIAKTTFEYQKKTYIQGQVVEGVTSKIEEYLKPFDVLELVEATESKTKDKKNKSSNSNEDESSHTVTYENGLTVNVNNNGE